MISNSLQAAAVGLERVASGSGERFGRTDRNDLSVFQTQSKGDLNQTLFSDQTDMFIFDNERFLLAHARAASRT